MNSISRFQALVAALAVLVMVASTTAFADVSPHTKAVLDGTLMKNKDGKGYVVHVESAKTTDGKELPDLKGKDMPLPEKMSDDLMKQCTSCCDKVCRIECDIDNGKIAKVKSIALRDQTKPGTKGAN